MLLIVGLVPQEFGFASRRDGGTPQLPVVREDLFEEEPVASSFVNICKNGVLNGIEPSIRRWNKNVELFFRRLREEILFVEIYFGDESSGFGIRIDGGQTRADENNSGIGPVAVDEIKKFLSLRRIGGFRR